MGETNSGGFPSIGLWVPMWPPGRVWAADAGAVTLNQSWDVRLNDMKLLANVLLPLLLLAPMVTLASPETQVPVETES